ncbi:MAG TPA: hypothetical protein VE690_23755 [Rhodopila sp.]|nr:hypothetical protein [Rhodopila sp.]
MSRFVLSRRAALFLPLAIASCGESEPEERFEPLRYNYLPPIELKVASISIEQRFVPAGVAPDVSGEDPVPPIEALKAMANDRLLAFGTENKAVFTILNASLTRQDEVIAGTFEVSLTIDDNGGNRLGFATAQVHSEHTGRIGDLRKTLYEMTQSMMSNMNVEFEYQVRRNLKPWLTTPAAPDVPVEQAPLEGAPGAGAPSAPSGPGAVGSPPGSPSGGPPAPGAPPAPTPVPEGAP